MLTPILDLLLIQCIIVFITDISGITHYIKKWIWKYLRGTTNYPPSFELHLVECSLCQTWWIGLIYLIITHNISIPMIAYVAALSYLTTSTNLLLRGVKNNVDKLIDALWM